MSYELDRIICALMQMQEERLAKDTAYGREWRLLSRRLCLLRLIRRIWAWREARDEARLAREWKRARRRRGRRS